MDNLGIFKLLNSMYDFYKKNNSVSENKEGSPPPNETEYSSPQQKNNQTSFAHIPLQNGMLSVMARHDQVVRRVMEQNNDKK